MDQSIKRDYKFISARGLCYVCGKDKKRVIEFEVVGEADDELIKDIEICRKCYKKNIK